MNKSFSSFDDAYEAMKDMTDGDTSVTDRLFDAKAVLTDSDTEELVKMVLRGELNPFKNTTKKPYNVRQKLDGVVSRYFLYLIEKSTIWNLKKSSSKEDMRGIDYWGSTMSDPHKRVSIQLKHRVDGSGDDLLLELTKTWIPQVTKEFNGKESKRVDVYFFIDKDYILYMLDGKEVRRVAKEGLDTFIERTNRNPKLSKFNTEHGQLRAVKIQSKQDTKKKVEHQSKQKLLYFVNPKLMPIYDGLERESIKNEENWVYETQSSQSKKKEKH
jgi:hypothetical protein